jgi:hypothetical protein
MKKLIGFLWDRIMKQASQKLIQKQDGKDGVQNLQNGVAVHRFIHTLSVSAGW